MSEPDDIETLGRRVLEKSRHSPLQERMRAFLDEHSAPEDVTGPRERAGRGTSLGDVVIDDREERL